MEAIDTEKTSAVINLFSKASPRASRMIPWRAARPMSDNFFPFFQFLGASNSPRTSNSNPTGLAGFSWII